MTLTIARNLAARSLTTISRMPGEPEFPTVAVFAEHTVDGHAKLDHVVTYTDALLSPRLAGAMLTALRSAGYTRMVTMTTFGEGDDIVESEAI